MKRTVSVMLAALMMIVVLVGCGSNNGGAEKSDIVGTWVTEKVAANGTEMTLEEFKKAAGDELGGMVEMTFTFTADGKVNVKSSIASGDATWTEEGDKISIDENGTKIELSKNDGKLVLEQSGSTITLAKK